MSEVLGIVIVNYNSGDFLKKCVNSIYSIKNIETIVKVVIVDNNSKDQSLNFTLKENIKIIENKENKGFGHACNQAANSLPDADYLLFLNPDTEVDEVVIKASLDFLKKNGEVSILGVCHLDEKGDIKPSCSRTPKPKNIVWDIFGLSKMFPNIFKPATLMSDFDHRNSKFVNQVMGAYMIMEKKIFDRLNGFDTRFFVFYEDADFALRARNLGYRSYYKSDIKIIHHGRGTTKKISDIALFYNLRSRIQFVKKHYSTFDGLLITILTLIFEPFFRILYNILKGNIFENRNVIRAFKYLYKDIFKIKN